MILSAKEVYESGFNAGLMPDLDIPLLDYVSEYGVLAKKGSAEAGKYRPDRTPYLKAIYRCLSPESPYKITVHIKGTQVGATEVMNQWFIYVVDIAPGPMQFIFPNNDAFEKHSKLKLGPIIEASDRIRHKISEPKSRGSSNTIGLKEFDGGSLILGSAQTGVTFRHVSVQYQGLDDVDGFPWETKGEGDTLTLAMNRTDSYGNKKKIYINGTPTIKGFSFIEKWYLKSDQRTYHVPCPLCNFMQVLIFDNIKFEHNDYFLESHAKYECVKCKKTFQESYKTDMLDAGDWVPKYPKRKIAGFHTPSFYSPLGWLSWNDIAQDFLDAKKENDPRLLQRVYNTRFAMTWEVKGDTVSETPLMERREEYKAPVPMGVGVLTCAVDVHDDRLEMETVGWGKKEESWSIDYKIIYGNAVKPLVWEDLDEYLLSTWKHESGVMLRIVCTVIDSGDNTQMVYKFVKPREGRRIYAIKGRPGVGVPLVGRPTKSNTQQVKLFPVGTITAKDLLFARLKLEKFGAGYCHFPDTRELEYFKQLTAEKRLPKYIKGRRSGHHYVEVRVGNHALDARIYNMAALEILRPNLDLLVDRLQKEEIEEKDNTGKIEPEQKNKPPFNTQPKKLKRRKKNSFVNRW